MINKLITRIKETNAPIVVGLDPMMKFVPEYIKKAAFTRMEITTTKNRKMTARPLVSRMVSPEII